MDESLDIFENDVKNQEYPMSMKPIMIEQDIAEKMAEGIKKLYNNISLDQTPKMGHFVIDDIKNKTKEALGDIFNDSTNEIVEESLERLSNAVPLGLISTDIMTVIAGDAKKQEPVISISLVKTYTTMPILNFTIVCVEQDVNDLQNTNIPMAQFQLQCTADFAIPLSLPVIIWTEQGYLEILLSLMDALISDVDLKGIFESLDTPFTVYQPEFSQIA